MSLGLTNTCSGGSQSQIQNCCTSGSPCKVNEGDCDSDSECAGALVCGKNNCGRAFTWKWADCCEAVSSSCKGGSKEQTQHCCTSGSPCKSNEGDCDSDSECEGNLVCGKNNCGTAFTWKWADCCELPETTTGE